MISDDERREVAARLRNELQYMKKRSWWYEGAMVEEGGNAAFRNIAGAVKPGSNFNDEYIETVERLADLIDRPTTTRHGKFRTKYGRETPCCEVCGYSIGDMRWNHCPKCGAVIADD